MLEDDCLPHPSFFRVLRGAARALSRATSGSCTSAATTSSPSGRAGGAVRAPASPGRTARSPSYYFSRYPHVWGWASWRRAWSHYDFEMTAVASDGDDSAARDASPTLPSGHSGAGRGTGRAGRDRHLGLSVGPRLSAARGLYRRCRVRTSSPTSGSARAPTTRAGPRPRSPNLPTPGHSLPAHPSGDRSRGTRRPTRTPRGCSSAPAA